MDQQSDHTMTPGAFPVLAIGGLVAVILGMAVPFTSGGESGSIFESDPGSAVTFVAFFVVPIVAGCLFGRSSAFMVGVAAGAALLLGGTITLIWSLTLGIVMAVGESGGDSIGAGLVLMAIGSVALIIAALSSARFRMVGRAADHQHSPVAYLGVVSGLAGAVGLLIPPEGSEFADWSGFAAYPLFGVAFVVLIGGFVFVVLAGFLGGRWGVGVVAVFVAIVVLSNFLSASDRSLFAPASSSDANTHDLARFGFYAMAGLLVIHAVQVFATTSAGVATRSASAHPARWADDPFGRHQSRYWDGLRWSDQVADAGVVATDPATASPVASPFAAPPAASPFAAPAPLVAPQTQPEPIRAHTNVQPVAQPSSEPYTQTIVRPVASAPTVNAGEEHDGRTIRRLVVDEFRDSDAATLVLVFDVGQRTMMSTPLVIGRDPIALVQTPGATLLALDDSTMSVSKTHLAIGPDAGGVWVEDVGSSNGTAVTAPSGESFSLVPGARMSIPIGSTVQFGDRSLRVEMVG